MLRLYVGPLLAYVLLCGWGLAFAAGPGPEKRVALVIGVGHYEHAPTLRNPVNDARRVAEALRGLNFEVDERIDPTYAVMKTTLREFGLRAKKAAAAVVFYAGHGVQVEHENYLIPRDAKLERQRDLLYEALSLDLFLGEVSQAQKVGIIILDACRDNPFGERIERSMKTAGRATGSPKGLARVDSLPRNTAVAMATKSNEIAEDGDGEDSPYSQAILAHLGIPGLELGLFFRSVRDTVLKATNYRQEPYIFSSMGAEPFYFNPPGSRMAAAPPPAADNPWQKLAQGNSSSEGVDALLRSFAEALQKELGRRQAEEEARKEAERQQAERQAAERQEAEKQEAERQQRLAAQEAERQRLAAQEAERQRVAAQAAKQEAERREAERQRVAAEAAKQEAERREAERQRVAADAAKQEAERQRLAAETAKKDAANREAERQRLAAEAARQEAERRDAERQRLAAEAANQEAERQRLAAEAARKESERRDAERQRVAAEAARKEGEAARKAAERQEAEHQRQAQEAARREAETARKAAERDMTAERQRQAADAKRETDRQAAAQRQAEAAKAAAEGAEKPGGHQIAQLAPPAAAAAREMGPLAAAQIRPPPAQKPTVSADGLLGNWCGSEGHYELTPTAWIFHTGSGDISFPVRGYSAAGDTVAVYSRDRENRPTITEFNGLSSGAVTQYRSRPEAQATWSYYNQALTRCAAGTSMPPPSAGTGSNRTRLPPP